AEIVRLCGHLPLAIVLLAGRLAHHPAWTLTGLAEEFRTAQDRLGELDAGQRAVRAAFTASYDNLPPSRQQVFRTLGLHPGTDFDVYAVAALNDIPLTEARTELDALYTDNLIQETTLGRYCMHDLVREYIRALTSAASSGNAEAVERLLDYYRRTAAAADRWLTRRPRPDDDCFVVAGAVVQEFSDERHALAWMRTERANLLACVEYTADHDPARMIELTKVLAALLERDGPWSSAVRLHQRAAAAADRLGNRLGQANALINLGIVQCHTGKRPIDLFRQALARYRAIGHPMGEADTLANLGGLYRYIGDYGQAVELLQQALTLYRATGHPLGEADAQAKLGRVLRDTGDYGQAAAILQQALILYRENGFRLGEAGTLGILGAVHRETGNYDQATDLLLRGAALSRELGNRDGEALALGNLGLVRRHIGDHEQAAAHIQHALTIFREIGHRRGEATNLNNLATVYHETGNHEQAASLSRQALTLFQETGFRLGEAEALANTAKALLASGKPGEALPMFTAASTVANSIDSRITQARASEGLARCQAALGDTNTAVTHLRHAIDLYRHLGASETDTATTYLAALEALPPEIDSPH
ncbi:tetratricopeptide repeat protein, partial [Nocardia sp. NPDC050175]|uniref:tetratricopeptide repeat protein n=1 Tax=Nocardia sp. NPDC050175 TaxID=3364317 RepID=UPI0037B50C7B